MTSRWTPRVLISVTAICCASVRIASQSVNSAKACQPTPSRRVCVEQVRPTVWVFRGLHGNVVLHAGASESLLGGVPDRQALDSARHFIEARALAPLRKLVVFDGDSAEVLAMLALAGDSAVAFAQENVRNRFLGHLIEKMGMLSAPVGFSDVLQLNVGGEEIHTIHQPAGYATSDVLTHFERSNVVLFGLGVVSDTYPPLNASRGADVSGILQSLDHFLGYPAGAVFVPGRGPLMTVADVIRYHTILNATSARVRALVDSGASEEKVLRSIRPQPLGQGAQDTVGAREFVRRLYEIARRSHGNGAR